MARSSRRSGTKPPGAGKPVSYTLDQFNIGDLRLWQRSNRDIEEYHLRVYYELEAQRQLHRSELFSALKDAKHPSPFVITRWVRLVPFKYSNQPLSAVGSIRSIGGRFNFGETLRPSTPFHALYLAEDADTAFREYFGMQSDERRSNGKLSPLDLALAPKKSIACINVSGTVTNLLDITQAKSLQTFCDVIGKFTIDPKSRELIRQTRVQPLQVVRDPEMLMKTMMAQNWRELGAQLELPSNSQIFGQIAFQAGYDGVLFNSTRGNGRCLCLFVENLTYSETSLKLADEAPTSDTITELNSDTWSKLVTPFNLLKAAGRLIRAHIQ